MLMDKILKKMEGVLRITIAGEFLGHGVFALQGKEAWIGWFEKLVGIGPELASQILPLIGMIDIAVAIIVLVKPFRVVLIWAVAWGFWTALLRPLVGEPIWDFVERWANWGAPLALFLLYQYRKKGEKNI